MRENIMDRIGFNSDSRDGRFQDDRFIEKLGERQDLAQRLEPGIDTLPAGSDLDPIFGAWSRE
jgi:hypothetical protein